LTAKDLEKVNRFYSFPPPGHCHRESKSHGWSGKASVPHGPGPVAFGVASGLFVRECKSNRFSGFRFSGFRFSGLRFSGFRFSGLRFSGLRFSGFRFSGFRFSGFRFSGLRFSGLRFSGFRIRGKLFALNSEPRVGLWVSPTTTIGRR